jgi:uncharacterized protein (TIGR02996 family)
MSDEAFLKAICDNPDDDLPRLIYADWLDERGDLNSAEFIRLQCALAAGRDLAGQPISKERRTEMEARTHVLLPPVKKRMIDALHKTGARKIQSIQIKRGFPEAITLDAADFHGAEELLSQFPIASLTVTKLDAAFLDSLNSPHLRTLRTLTLTECGDGDSVARAIAASQYLAQLHELRFGHNPVHDAGAEALAASPHLRNLKVLDLNNTHVSDAGARALAASPHLCNLKALHLGGNPIGAGGAQALAASPHFRAAMHLSMNISSQIFHWRFDEFQRWEKERRRLGRQTVGTEQVR